MLRRTKTAARLGRLFDIVPFSSSGYWQRRYENSGDSGAGSYGRLAEFKAEVLNAFVANHEVASVIELGCGDGNQLSLAHYPRYLGLDPSPHAIRRCAERFKDDLSKSFMVYDSARFSDPAGFLAADLSLSLDVVYHLVEDEIFDAYMRHLFGVSSRYVAIYSSNMDDGRVRSHVRHRKFTGWIERHLPDWALRETIVNRYPFDPARPEDTSFADFYIFEKAAR